MIAIIGGGIIGTSIAFHLARAGIKDIVLYEKDNLLGTGVTQFCSGGVRSQFTTPVNILFSICSLKYLDQMAAVIDYKKPGYLVLDMEEDSMLRIKLQNSLGVASEYLTPADISKRFPYINTDGIKSASYFSEDGIADPASLLLYWEKEAKKLGVVFKTKVEIKKLVKEENKVIGFETDRACRQAGQGQVKADLTILAAGVGSKMLGKTVGIDIPIVNRRKYIFEIEGFGFDFPLVMAVPTGWYIKKEGQSALVGMSGKEEKIDLEFQQQSLEETVYTSVERFPLVEKSGLKRTMSSLSDETPDKHAIIDDSVAGLIIATGFSGHGFMHSPAVGQVVTSLAKGQVPEIDISCLRLDRELVKEPIAI